MRSVAKAYNKRRKYRDPIHKDERKCSRTACSTRNPGISKPSCDYPENGEKISLTREPKRGYPVDKRRLTLQKNCSTNLSAWYKNPTRIKSDL